MPSIDRFLSSRVSRIPSYPLLQINSVRRQLEAKGVEVIDLAGGIPEVEAPRHVVDATRRAVGVQTEVTPMGMLALREAIAEKLKKDDGSEVDPAEVLITPGSKASLYVSILSTINAGDEILVPSPYFHPYLQQIAIAGGKPVLIPCREGGTFRLRPKEVESRVTENTKMIILNYPNNPAGWTLTKQELKEVVEIAHKHDLLVVSDEIYDEIIFDEVDHHHITSFDDARERTILCNSFSKTYCMIRYRLGYIVADRSLINHMAKLLIAMITQYNPFVQAAGLAALKGPQDFVDERRKTYQRRRDFALKQLNKIQGVRCSKPHGAFYVFPNLHELSIPSMELAKRLIEEVHVATTPGICFGNWDTFLRIALTDEDENIERAIARIEDFIEKHRNTGSVHV
jgi:aspartate/methionine/tyrosine aminotransferase